MKIMSAPRFSMGFYRDMGDDDTGDDVGGTQGLIGLNPVYPPKAAGPETLAANTPGNTYADRLGRYAASHAMKVFGPRAGSAAGIGDVISEGNGTGIDTLTGQPVAIDPSIPAGLSASSPGASTSFISAAQENTDIASANAATANSDLANSALRGLINVGTTAAQTGLQIGAQAAYRAAFGAAPPQRVAVPVAQPSKGLLSGATGLLVVAGGAYMLLSRSKGASSTRKNKRKGGKRRKR